MEPTLERPGAVQVPAKNPKQPDGDPQSTPPSQNLAATAQGLINYTANNVRSPLRNEIENTQTADVRRFIHFLLSLVSAVEKTNEPVTETVLQNDLANCIKNVQHEFLKNKELKEALYEALDKYCDASSENGRCKPFVALANIAFVILHKLVIAEAKAAPDPESGNFFLLMVQDPAMMRSRHVGEDHDRKPDINASLQQYISPLYNNLVGEALRKVVIEAPTKQEQTSSTQAPQQEETPSSTQAQSRSKKKKVPKKKETLSTAAPQEGTSSSTQVPQQSSKEANEVTSGTAEPSAEEIRSAWKRSFLCGEMKFKKEITTKAVRLSEPTKQPLGPPPVSTASGSKSGQRATLKPEPELDDILKETKTANVQIAEYAAEAMFNSFGRDHVMNLEIVDSDIYIHYADHEGLIRTNRLNVVENHSYLLLLLFALQRLTPEQWGFIPGLTDINDDKSIDLTADWRGLDGNMEPSSGEGPGVQFTKTGDDEKMYGLSARATWVTHGKVHVAGSTPTAEALELPAVLKLSYAEISRTPEAEFVREAKKRLGERQCLDACSYLPVYYVAKEYPGRSTDRIRKTLGIELVPKAARRPCLLAMPEYQPIRVTTTDTKGVPDGSWITFLNAFFALFYCHALLWAVGIEHGDISERNLMWDPATNKPKLCDFDLAHYSDAKRPTGHSHTGTWMFMALDLLTIAASRGNVPRLYRHDAESFAAVLLWIMCRYRDGKTTATPLQAWSHTDYHRCRSEREETYNTIMKLAPPAGVPSDIWKGCTDLVSTIYMYVTTAQTLITQEELGMLSEDNRVLGEQLGTVKFVEFLLDRALFKIGDGPHFVEQIKKDVLGPLKAEAEA